MIVAGPRNVIAPPRPAFAGRSRGLIAAPWCLALASVVIGCTGKSTDGTRAPGVKATGQAARLSLVDVSAFLKNSGVKGALLELDKSPAPNENLPGLIELAQFGKVQGNTIEGAFVFLELYDTEVNAGKAEEFYRSRATWGQSAGLPTFTVVVNGRCLLKTQQGSRHDDVVAEVFKRFAVPE